MHPATLPRSATPVRLNMRFIGCQLRHLLTQEHVERFLAFSKPPVDTPAPTRPRVSHGKKVALPTFLNGRTLRSYQEESLDWMVKHCAVDQNCILGDEMGAFLSVCSRVGGGGVGVTIASALCLPVCTLFVQILRRKVSQRMPVFCHVVSTVIMTMHCNRLSSGSHVRRMGAWRYCAS